MSIDAKAIEFDEAKRIAELDLSAFVEIVLVAPDVGRWSRVYVADSRGDVSWVRATAYDLERLGTFKQRFRATHGYTPRHRTEIAISRTASQEWGAEIARARERFRLYVAPKLAADLSFLD
jgi:hypothetical protein